MLWGRSGAAAGGGQEEWCVQTAAAGVLRGVLSCSGATVRVGEHEQRPSSRRTIAKVCLMHTRTRTPALHSHIHGEHAVHELGVHALLARVLRQRK